MTTTQPEPLRVVPLPQPKEPLWRDVVGDVLRRERLAQERTLKEVAEEARISMPYLSEVERGRKEASSEVLAAAAHALGLRLADLLGRVQEEILRTAQPALRSETSLASVTRLGSRSSATRAAGPGAGEVRLAA
ncbi:helix-turn-helix transcriptional regulator [Streptomyces sp. A7024]|uniref:Helix-turn-helix transcriptional regulator n=1 Tax=Streptomyces coryli TaxID=1128680 RepID=A0A6G4TUJ5_9ACTN|nr:helix-turn-helix transcriptional regulator [Streptomyces coryli]NGN63442.1 helix-turn-helix transcriptional regulator [Streptomyces coryli]